MQVLFRGKTAMIRELAQVLHVLSNGGVKTVTGPIQDSGDAEAWLAVANDEAKRAIALLQEHLAKGPAHHETTVGQQGRPVRLAEGTQVLFRGKAPMIREIAQVLADGGVRTTTGPIQDGWEPKAWLAVASGDAKRAIALHQAHLEKMVRDQGLPVRDVVTDFDAEEAQCPACLTTFKTAGVDQCPDCGLRFR